MARAGDTRPQVLTANSLGSGQVVYAGPCGWTEDLAKAALFRSPEAAGERLKAAAADVRACRIVEPYLFAVEEVNGSRHPVSVRETIRACGPSVRLDPGKQAPDPK